MARKIAVDFVRARYCDKCEVTAIGKAEPVSVVVDTFGTGKACNHFFQDYICENYDLTPRGIIDYLFLLKVDYNDVSAGSHFGKNWLPWEADDEIAADIYGDE